MGNKNYSFTFQQGATVSQVLGVPDPASGGTGGSTSISFAVDYGGLPAGLSLSAYTALGGYTNNPQITGTIYDNVGTYNIVIITSDLMYSWDVTITITASSDGATDKPVISVPAATPNSTGGTLTIPASSAALILVTATQSGTGWGISTMPSGFVLSSVTGIGSCDLLGSIAPGFYAFTIYCVNSQGASLAYILQLTVTVSSPVVTDITTVGGVLTLPYTGAAGDQYRDVLSAGIYAGPCSWSATGLPAGLVINPGTGTISGILASPGSYSVTVTATNSVGSGTLSMTIVIIGATQIPVVTLSPTQIGLIGYTVTAGSVSGQTPITFPTGAQASIYFNATQQPISSWAAIGLPTGLTINTSTGVVTGKIVNPGTYQFSVTATNTIGTSTPLNVVVEATGSASAFSFVSADPTLQDIQVDIRTGAVTSSNPLAMKQLINARFAIVFLDHGAPVTPPDASSIGFGIRPYGKFNEGYLFTGVTPTLVNASGSDPAYLLYAFEVDSDELTAQLNAMIATLDATPGPGGSLPSLSCMADITWISSGNQRASQTFALTITPAVTE